MNRSKHKIFFFLYVLFIGTLPVFAQEPVIQPKKDVTDIIDKIEGIAENTDAELDYTDLIEDLKYYRENPVNLNYAKEEELKRLYFLNDLQINNLLVYIQIHGELVSIYELQLIKGFDTDLINKILPYITISKEKPKYKFSFKKMLKYGRNQFIIRYQRILEEQEGYKSINDSDLIANPNSRYLGSPDKIYLRYGYNYFNKIRIGLTTEKDAGEVFFKKNINNAIYELVDDKINNGFDFYSAFLYLKDFGIIKTLAIGDYHLQFGQGLTMWSSLAFAKSADATNVKRYAYGIKPNTSVNENKFMRGIATTINIKNFDISVFYSRKKIDANITETDSLTNEILFISSLQETGSHRTPNEITDKNVIEETVLGGNISYKNHRLKLGATAFKTELGTDLKKIIYPYNQFEFNGNENTNVGLDYSYLLKNISLFGEVSQSMNGGMAFLQGMTMMLDPRLTLSIIYRNYQKDYQNLFSNAFAENSKNANEQGLYTGIRARLHPKWILYVYIDNFNFPWLKFRVDAPSTGNEYLAQLDYNLSRKTHMYFRYRQTNKQINNTNEINYIDYLDNTNKQNFRYHIAYSISRSFILKNRVEYVYYKQGEKKTNHGYMIYQDVAYRPPEKRYTFILRYALFDTDTYDERVYVYENDVLYAFSVPSYYYKGSRFYLLIKYDISRNFDFWLRYAQSYFSNRTTISSGLDEVDGNVKSEIKAQVRFKF